MSGPDLRICSACGEAKPRDAFPPRKGRCRPCLAAELRAWNAANVERVRAYSRARWQAIKADPVRRAAKAEADRRNYLRVREAQIARQREAKIGVSAEKYAEAYRAQNGQCAICCAHSLGLTRRLGADHDHETGAFRGLLCGRCNSALGLFLDDEVRVASAAAYLRRAAEGRPVGSWVKVEVVVEWVPA